MRRMARKQITFIDLGYIHPATNKWHSKRFTNIDEAEAAKRIILAKDIPCVQLTSTKEFTVYGCSEEEFIASFVAMGDEWDIDEEDSLVHAVFRKIVDRAADDRVAICGNTYTIQDDMIHQDEQWAAVYNSYSGYDKVGIYSLYNDNGDEVICFYWAL